MEPKINNAKITSIISYFSFVGWIVAYLLNNPKTEHVSFHLRQSLGINLLFIVCGFIFVVPILGWIAGIVGYILGALIWVMGLFYAVDQQEKLVPILGEYFQEWFQAI